jgi:predicted ribosome quality control (RQC) complex YloA/Tae2 family protein
MGRLEEARDELQDARDRRKDCQKDIDGFEIDCECEQIVEEFEASLDEYGFCSEVIKALDRTMYNEELSDFADGYDPADLTEYQHLMEELEDIENEILDLEEEIEELEDEDEDE